MATDENRELLDQAAATLRTLPYEAWHYGDSVAFEAMLQYSKFTGDPSLANFAHGMLRGWEATRSGYQEMDNTAPGRALCQIAATSGDQIARASALKLARHLIARRKVGGVFATWEQSPLRQPYGPDRLDAEGMRLFADPGPGVFVDCLHFDPPFLSALTSLTADTSWRDLAIDQANGYIRLLQNTADGLFYHFYLEHSGSHHISGWGRGQGWALLGLLDVLEDAGDRSDIAGIRASARELVLAMLRHQNDDGSWFAVVNDPQSGSESSTAAFMAIGFRRARELGIATPEEVDDAIAAALRSTLRNLDRYGVLGDATVAVWASTQQSHYSHVPKGPITPWGQGPTVLALLEMMQHV